MTYFNRIRLLLLCISLLTPILLRAQTSTPRLISYQGFVRGADNQAISGNHRVSIAFYSNKEGTQLVWQGQYETQIEGGVFNILLGSGTYPLPDPQKLSQLLYVGVTIDNGAEMRPLSQMAGVPYSLSVADSSITRDKIAADYVSAIAVNGKKVTGNGTTLNLTNGHNAYLSYDEKTGGLSINSLNPIDNRPQSVSWDVNGNSLGADSWLGSKDSFAVEIRLDDNTTWPASGTKRVMRYEPNDSSANIIGGHYSNSVSGYGNVISGGGLLGHPNLITGSYSTIGGGRDNIVVGNHSTVVGGLSNVDTGDYSFIGGGVSDTIWGNYSSILGGFHNSIIGDSSVILGGRNMRLGKNSIGYSQYAGGVSGHDPVVMTTIPNIFYIADVDVWIGTNNTAKGRELRIGAPPGAGIGAGGLYTSFEAGGQTTYIHYMLPPAQANWWEAPSALVNDGYGHLRWLGADSMFGSHVDTINWKLHGNSNTDPSLGYYLGTHGNNAFEIHVNDSGAVNQGDKRVMRFEPNASSANIIGGYQENQINNGAVGSVISGGGAHGNQNTISAGYAGIVGGCTNRIDSTADKSFIGGGSFNTIYSKSSVIVGGSNDTIYSIRTATPAEKYSFIGGGLHNVILDDPTLHYGGGVTFIDTSMFGVIVGGRSNVIMDSAVFLGGGDSNAAMQGWSTIVGGRANYSNGMYTSIGGGKKNSAGSHYATVVGGYHNYAAGRASFVGGGGDYLHPNYIPNTAGGAFSVVVGGIRNQATGDGTVVVAGDSNWVTESSIFSGILTGRYNKIDSSIRGFIGGGEINTIRKSSNYSALGGGFRNTIDSNSLFSVISGGRGNTIYSGGQRGFQNSNIPGGDSLIAKSYAQTVVGFYNKSQGTSSSEYPEFGQIVDSDRVFIIGNGRWDRGADTAKRSNAFEVSNNGHSIVYGNLGDSLGLSARNGMHSAVRGARYMDNTMVAWGDVPASGFTGPVIPNSSFGVLSVSFSAPNQYLIILDYTDPYSGAQVDVHNRMSVVATPYYEGHGCTTVTVDQPTWTTGHNQFVIKTWNPGSSCSPTINRFSFQVMARP